MRQIFSSIMLSVIVLALPISSQADTTSAQTEFKPPDFVKADANSDRQVDKSEQERIIIYRFDIRDLNNDGQLTEDELPSEYFPNADQNQDKTVSKTEFMRFRFGYFDRYDQDNNDMLDNEEYRRWLDSQ